MTSTDSRPVRMDVRGWAKKAIPAALASCLAAIWARFQPAQPHRWAPPIAPSDNLQRPMNLIMPLASTYLVDRGRLAKGLVQATEMVVVGLNNVGTVHFARFDIIGSDLCMISIYDGELSGSRGPRRVGEAAPSPRDPLVRPVVEVLPGGARGHQRVRGSQTAGDEE